MTCRKDEEGYYIPEDDPEVKDEHSLRRMIDLARFYHPDKGISGGAFQMSTAGKYGPNPGMSTEWIEAMNAAGIPANDVPREYLVAAAFGVGEVRNLDKENVMVGHTPVIDNPFHSDVWGLKSEGKRKLLRNRATYFVKDSGDMDLESMLIYLKEYYNYK